ncbi:MAG: YciI family protein [Vicinamibacteria bacterium]
MTNPADYPTDDDLKALSAAAEPPTGLEERVVAALRRERLLAPRRGPRHLLLTAAALACVAVGWLARDQFGRTVQDVPGLYLLLLSKLPESTDSAAQARFVEEYRQWANGLRGEGRLVRGEKLGGEARDLGAIAPEGSMNPSGFFLIRARSLEEATALARGCPHLRRGGSITIRNVDPT